MGTRGVFVASVALVGSASTLVSDFTGFAGLGWAFVAALALGFGIVLPLALSAARLAVAYPQAGGIYQMTRSVVGGRSGQLLGAFLGFGFLGAFLFGAAGEATAGAQAAQALLRGAPAPAPVLAAAIVALAVAANLLGLKRAAWTTGGLLAVMLGIRLFFGIAGFLGWSATGAWSAEHLAPPADLAWFGAGGLLARGLALGFWSFVGIEGACALVEETHRPARSLPRGLVLGLVTILGVAVVMGVGATGTLPLAAWQEAVRGAPGRGGECPQLAVGELMFGAAGRDLMAIASLAATLSTLTMALAAAPRLIFALARDGLWFGACSGPFARLHSRTGAPVAATLFIGAALVLVTFASSSVVECLQAAAYLWFGRYLVIHALAIVNALRARRRRAIAGAALGIAGTLLTFHCAYDGAHGPHALRAALVLAGALVFTTAAAALSGRREANRRELPPPVIEPATAV